jgi:hypothetical protein
LTNKHEAQISNQRRIIGNGTVRVHLPAAAIVALRVTPSF